MLHALQLQEAFEEAGIPTTQARNIVEKMEVFVTENVATRQDVDILHSEMKGEFVAVRNEMKGEFVAVRKDFDGLRNDFEMFRKDVNCKFDVQRAETKAEFAALRKEMAEGFMKFNLASGFFVALALLLLKLFGLSN